MLLKNLEISQEKTLLKRDFNTGVFLWNFTEHLRWLPLQIQNPMVNMDFYFNQFCILRQFSCLTESIDTVWNIETTLVIEADIWFLQLHISWNQLSYS